MSNSRYTIVGSRVFVGSALDSVVTERLPENTYVVSFDPNRGFFLAEAPNFERPEKLYGNVEKMALRFLNTFEDRPGTTGVLLDGTKGSGKSLTMKVTSALGRARGYPTLVVSSPFSGDEFNKFIQQIDQRCLVVFDEFEKVYGYNSQTERNQQEELLTLFDGAYPSDKLMIVTCNDSKEIDNHMKNRPGRLFYSIKYLGLATEAIREYCDENLDDRSKGDAIVMVAGMIEDFNFDMLKALVEEANRYPNETVRELIMVLNIEYDMHSRQIYDVDVEEIASGAVLSADMYQPTYIQNPLQHVQFDVAILAQAKKRQTAVAGVTVGHEDDDDEFSYPSYGGNVVSKKLAIPVQAYLASRKFTINADLTVMTCDQDGYRVTFRKRPPFNWDVFERVL